MKSECNHRYSKAMNQPYPRLCVVCGEPEREHISVPCAFCEGTIDLAVEDTCTYCGKSHFEDPAPYENMAELLEKLLSCFNDEELNEIKMRNEHGWQKGKAFKLWCYNHPNIVNSYSIKSKS